MPEPTIAMVSDPADDLPRTLRREREARERAAARIPDLGTAREPAAPTKDFGAPWPPRESDLQPAIVRAIDVPFFRLVTFFLKAALAALPALALLTVICIAAGQGLKLIAPDLRVFRIVVELMPVSQPTAPVPIRAPEPAKAPAPSAKK